MASKNYAARAPEGDLLQSSTALCNADWKATLTNS